MKVTANIATHNEKGRLSTLEKAIDSIYSQVEVVRVCLNGFDTIPAFLNRENIITHIPKKDLADNGKFFWATNSNEYYFTIDDDIIYPPDYVERSLKAIKQYDEKTILTYHGVILKPQIQDYYLDRCVLPFASPLKRDLPVDVGGTGVMLINTNGVSINHRSFKTLRMADIWIAKSAFEQGCRIVCVNRSGEWLVCNKPGEGIFETTKDSSEHAEIINKYRPNEIINLFRHLKLKFLLKLFKIPCYPGR